MTYADKVAIANFLNYLRKYCEENQCTSTEVISTDGKPLFTAVLQSFD